MEKNGWIKIHRKILENPISNKPNYLALWIILLLKANHQNNDFIFNEEKMTCSAGKLLTGRKKLSQESGIKEGTVETILNYFESQHQIQQQKTNKFRLITVKNWNKYQQDKQQNQQQTDNKLTTNRQQTDNKLTTNRQQNDTNKNDKNVKNDKNDKNDKNVLKNKNNNFYFLKAEAEKEKKIDLEKIEEKKNDPINKLIGLFADVNPTYQRLYPNINQRKALERMLKLFGEENLIKIIITLKDIVFQEFAPRITTPIELENKMGLLQIFIKNIKNKQIPSL